MISLDTETTGVDFHFGARPFLVTICSEEGEQHCWEWDVDPLTRSVSVPESDLDEIQFWLDRETEGDSFGEGIVLQNAKFDVKALSFLRKEMGDTWRWGRTQDTLMAGHLLASNQPHDLTSMAIQYLGVNVQEYEDRMHEAVEECRRICRRDYPEWQLAKQGRADMPSAKEKCWKLDTWLPRALATELKLPEDHEWWTVTQEYANSDSAVTIQLWKAMRRKLTDRSLNLIYQERMKLLPIAYKMEERGVSINAAKKNKLTQEYQQTSDEAEKICMEVARKHGFPLKLPKGARNNSLVEFMFNVLKLPVIGKTDTGNAAIGGDVMDEYSITLPEGDGLKFIKALAGKRKRDAAISAMDAYERFWHPFYETTRGGDKRRFLDWFLIHPSLNPTGTDTLRWSSNNPNSQSISKKEDFNLRYCFGPAPGREWWSLDGKNLELRLSAYDSNEPEMIALFERPDDAPYYGSNHLLVSHILHPEKFEACRGNDGKIDGRIFKKKYADTYYGWVKNGNFAVQYGAMAESGTADRAYHVKGGQLRIEARFKKIAELNQRCIKTAERLGYIETIPDKTVDPLRGYPLLCTRTSYGRIKPTVPLNYRIQGTAMWWMGKAMVRCQAQLDQWNAEEGIRDHYAIALQVHDELVFDFPVGKGPEPWKTNHPKIRKLQRLMEEGGRDINIPTPVSCEYHDISWSTGIGV